MQNEQNLWYMNGIIFIWFTKLIALLLFIIGDHETALHILITCVIADGFWYSFKELKLI